MRIDCSQIGKRRQRPSSALGAHTSAARTHGALASIFALEAPAPSRSALDSSKPPLGFPSSRQTPRDSRIRSPSVAMSVPHAIATRAPIACGGARRGPTAAAPRGDACAVAPLLSPHAAPPAAGTDAPRAARLAGTARPMAAATGPDGYTVDGMGCAEVDEQLNEHEGHLKYRWEKFLERKNAIKEAEASLDEFAKGLPEVRLQQNHLG